MLRNFSRTLCCVVLVAMTSVADAQLVRIGPLGGVRVRVPFVSVDVLPYGQGTRVRAPFTSVNTGLYGYGNLGHYYPPHDHGIYGPAPPYPAGPGFVRPVYPVPAYPTPVYPGAVHPETGYVFRQKLGVGSMADAHKRSS